MRPIRKILKVGANFSSNRNMRELPIPNLVAASGKFRGATRRILGPGSAWDEEPFRAFSECLWLSSIC